MWASHVNRKRIVAILSAANSFVFKTFDSGELYLHHDLRNAIADAQSEVQQLPCARLGIEFAARIPANTINMGQ